MRKVPKFTASKHLCRHIMEEHRQDNDRASPAAFKPSPRDKYLSVNSCEVETQKQIAAYYSLSREEGARPVLISSNPVSTYVKALEDAGVRIKYNSTIGNWMTSGAAKGFGHYPIERKDNPAANSPSHCGVHFVSDLGRLELLKFAARLAMTTIKPI